MSFHRMAGKAYSNVPSAEDVEKEGKALLGEKVVHVTVASEICCHATHARHGKLPLHISLLKEAVTARAVRPDKDLRATASTDRKCSSQDRALRMGRPTCPERKGQ